MFVGLGGAFTGAHEDGFGTLDSGHLCLAGYNEVVILRRLDERHKEKAADIMGFNLSKRPNDEKQKGKVFSWPTTQMIQQLKECG